MATMEIAQVSATGNNAIDSLLTGVKWSERDVSYSFPTADSTFITDYSKVMEPQHNFAALTANMQGGVRQAFSLWESVANISFTEVADSTTYGVIRLGQSSVPSTAHAYDPGNDESSGDVWFGYNFSYTDPQWKTYSNYDFMSMVHEIGHSLGLKHPGNYSKDDASPFADKSIDALQYSIMSYISYPGAAANDNEVGNTSYPQTPMLDDIATIQYIYGANFNFSADNTTYAFSPSDTTIFQTVWDGNGIDTYDASAYNEGVTFQLAPGWWSTLGAGQLADLGNNVKAPGSVANAYLFQNDARSLIENAIGGSGNDILRGGPGDNFLSGGAGNDALWGWTGGNDTLMGGAGSDTYWFAADRNKDTIVTAADNNEDMVWFQTNWKPADVTVVLIDDDLHLTAGGTEEVLQGWGYGGGYQLNRFHFAQTGGTYQVKVSGTGPGQFVLVT